MARGDRLGIRRIRQLLVTSGLHVRRVFEAVDGAVRLVARGSVACVRVCSDERSGRVASAGPALRSRRTAADHCPLHFDLWVRVRLAGVSYATPRALVCSVRDAGTRWKWDGAD